MKPPRHHEAAKARHREAAPQRMNPRSLPNNVYRTWPADRPIENLKRSSTTRNRPEEKHGLLNDTATIGTRASWSARLAQRRFTPKGHRLLNLNARRSTKSS